MVGAKCQKYWYEIQLSFRNRPFPTWLLLIPTFRWSLIPKIVCVPFDVFWLFHTLYSGNCTPEIRFSNSYAISTCIAVNLLGSVSSIKSTDSIANASLDRLGRNAYHRNKHASGLTSSQVRQSYSNGLQH